MQAAPTTIATATYKRTATADTGPVSNNRCAMAPTGGIRLATTSTSSATPTTAIRDQPVVGIIGRAHSTPSPTPVTALIACAAKPSTTSDRAYGWWWMS